MKKTYRGSCHCKAVRFECEFDIAPQAPPGRDRWASTFKCNCTFCSKAGFWKIFVKPSAFRLLQGADVLADYQFGGRVVHQLACPRCAMHPFARGDEESMGGEFYCVNLNCLDDPTPEELATAPVAYEDGLHDDWDHPPPETRHL